MHISEGILPAPLLFCGAAFTVVGAAVGLKKLDYRFIPQAGLLAACFFVASLIHIPFAAGKFHLTLAGLIGIILGWGAFPVILASLILQSVFFQYGGITTLGVNTLIMALPAVIVSFPARRFIHKSSFLAKAVVFCAGFAAVLLSAFIMALFLFLTGEDFHHLSFFTLMGHLPLMVVEGVTTVFAVSFLQKVRPSILSPNHALKSPKIFGKEETQKTEKETKPEKTL